MWLISYKYRAWHTINGVTKMGEVHDAIEAISEHPVKYVTDMAKQYQAFRGGSGITRVDEPLCIYSVIEIPKEMEENLDSLL